MTHFRLTLAYDGTGFEGWQAQAGTREARTIQGVLEAALARLSGGVRIAVAGAGRTDAGVHARGQVASFELDRNMGANTLARALNSLLPRDVRVLEAAATDESFHARRSARSKLYRYEIDRVPVQLPQRSRYAAHVPGPLDEAAMLEMAKLYLGRHDFAAVASSGGSTKTSVRCVSRSEFVLAEEVLIYEVQANGFLRKMVRSLVGGIIAAGRAQRSVEDLRSTFAGGDRRRWPAPAPAEGLTLVLVEYDSDATVYS